MPRPLLGAVALALVWPAAPRAQTLDDGLMMSGGAVCAGVVAARDAWSEYWEGTLSRDNGNLGTVVTRSVTAMGAVGVTDRVNVIAMLPFVSTDATAGPLQSQAGVQDLTVGAKVRLLGAPFVSGAALRVHAVAAASVPVGDYTPDFMPLSIGTRSRRATGRLLADVEWPSGLFAGASAAYTARANVTLDRASYYTDGELYLTDRVDMPAVADAALRGGYRRGRLYVPLAVTAQRTLGGGDIRRQDMPFVSNRMDAVRVEGLVSYALPLPGAPQLRLGAARTLAGRNVGESTTVVGGVLYQFGLF